MLCCCTYLIVSVANMISMCAILNIYQQVFSYLPFTDYCHPNCDLTAFYSNIFVGNMFSQIELYDYSKTLMLIVILFANDQILCRCYSFSVLQFLQYINLVLVTLMHYFLTSVCMDVCVTCTCASSSWQLKDIFSQVLRCYFV